MYLPKARSDRLLVRELPEEILIYDQQSHKAHRLNRTVALVWQHCDGTRSPAVLARMLQEMLHVEDAEALVQLALEQLGRRNLLAEEPVTIPADARLFRLQPPKKWLPPPSRCLWS